MNSFKRRVTFFLFLSIFYCIAGVNGQSSPKMYAHFIDVGQAQAILLEFPKGAILIDAGATADKEVHLLNYLQLFFERRTDLHQTLAAVFITHQHVDHDYALKDIITHFKVLNYIDNGDHNPHGSGKNQLWMQQHAQDFQVHYEHFTREEIVQPPFLGKHDEHIDPIVGDIDPQITLLSSAFAQKPADWSASDFKNENNQSLVIRVQYGAASFLFTGDLEEKGLKSLLKSYNHTSLLDADVLQVGHHGAQNAINREWLQAVTPKFAVISCGHWNDGRLPDGKAVRFTTYAYGHPNQKALEMLSQVIPGNRAVPVTDSVGLKGSYRGSLPIFKPMTITKNIYATPWDGDITLSADVQGRYELVK